MAGKKYRARCIQWDRTDDDGNYVEVDLPSEVVVTLEDLQLPKNASIQQVEDELMVYLVDFYGFGHNGFFFEEVNVEE